ncbi:MAG: energy transducer TonB [Aureispira sp.]|nr:energy transducer TonB [Aureispira sp.]
MNKLFFLVLYIFSINSLIGQSDSVYTQVDIPPLFEGCNDPLISSEQQQACSAPQVMAFIRQHIVYPDSAKAHKTEGVVVVRFLVDAKGRVSSAELIRNIGNGCGQEALRIVRMFPDFEPAMKEGEPVASKMTLPIRFKIVDESATESFYQLQWGNVYQNVISKTDLDILLKQALEVRDFYGNIYEVKKLEVNYIFKNKIKSEKGNSGILTQPMLKMLQKSKPKGVIVFVAKIEKDVQTIEVIREFEIKPSPKK